MEKKKSKRRTIEERVEAIFKFIEEQNDFFPKSRLKEIGINAKDGEKWLKLIEYIQNQPRIRIMQTENNTFIEKIEGKYQAMMRKALIDEKIPHKQRLQVINDYINSLFLREKVEMERIKG